MYNCVCTVFYTASKATFVQTHANLDQGNPSKIRTGNLSSTMRMNGKSDEDESRVCGEDTLFSREPLLLFSFE